MSNVMLGHGFAAEYTAEIQHGASKLSKENRLLEPVEHAACKSRKLALLCEAARFSSKWFDEEIADLCSGNKLYYQPLAIHPDSSNNQIALAGTKISLAPLAIVVKNLCNHPFRQKPLKVIQPLHPETKPLLPDRNTNITLQTLRKC